MKDCYDILVVGGGINGAGIARDAAGRGFSVCLCERDDWGSHTSSASTKLIHGGLRYLEQYEFALVGKALAEREVLLRIAPHITHPLRFMLPHQPHLRPAWLIHLGMLLYDRLSFRRMTLPRSHRIDLRSHVTGDALRDDLCTGFVYSDASVQDARLVVMNVLDAAERGAIVFSRTACTHVERDNHTWTAQLQTTLGQTRTVHARTLVNATGPWAVQFLDDIAHISHRHALRLVKGSHLVVRKLFDHDYAYIFQQPDRRIVFAIPFERDFTLVGTTDVEYKGDAALPFIDTDETAYLCDAINRYFKQHITPSDVIWTYSGVRPLLEDKESNASNVTRDYLLQLDTQGAPLLSAFGGKLTTYRKLAEEAIDRLMPLLNTKASAWTAEGAPLPGGDCSDLVTLQKDLRMTYPWLPDGLLERFVHSYGTRCTSILGGTRSLNDLGKHFGADLYQAEIDYLSDHEWASQADDILWRRSKLGLRLTAMQAAEVDRYLQDRSSSLDGTSFPS